MAKGRRPTALRRQIIGNLRRRTIDISQLIRVVTVRYRGIPFAQAARRFGGSIVVLAGAAALTGCTSGPNFVRPDKPKEQDYTPENLVPQTAASAVSNGGAAQTFVPTEDIPGEWWKLFRSSELNALIDEALKANPDLDEAQASLRRANAALYAQQGTLFPTISANGSAQQLRASGVQQGGSVDTQLRLRSDDDIARLKALEAQMELARGRASRSARCSPCSSCRPSTSCSPRMIPRRA
jgi:hypothetical protein